MSLRISSLTSSGWSCEPIPICVAIVLSPSGETKILQQPVGNSFTFKDPLKGIFAFFKS